MTTSVVATVAGRPLTLAQLDARLAAIRQGPMGHRLPDDASPEALRLRRWVVQMLVVEAVVAHEAAVAGVADDLPSEGSQTPASASDGDGSRTPAPRLANGADPVADATTRAWARRLFERVTADVTVAETDVRAYYDRNPDRYARAAARRLRHRLFADEDAARQEVIRAAAGGDLAAEAGGGSSPAVEPPDGAWVVEDVRRGDLSGPFEDAAFAADLGAVVGPVATEFGWHVIRVEGITHPSTVPYAVARAEIQADLTAALRGKVFDDWLERRKQELAVFDPYWVHPGDPALPDLVHRH
jgi:[acyl-carrier-protein] S-malonyltransferase